MTGVEGLTLDIEEALFAKVGREGTSATMDSTGSGAFPGPRVAVMAATIVGRTLKFFNCFFKSDFAAFGAFLVDVSSCYPKLPQQSYWKRAITEFLAVSLTMPSASSRRSINVDTKLLKGIPFSWCIYTEVLAIAVVSVPREIT
jgi:hypothetical protein